VAPVRRSTIVPDNRKVLATSKANRHLLTGAEKEVLAVYQLHVEQFEARHILDDCKNRGRDAAGKFYHRYLDPEAAQSVGCP
jgi:hypothetical protein